MKKLLLLTFFIYCYCNLFGQVIHKLDSLPQTLGDINLSNDKFTIVEIWASWCSPCIESIKKIDALENLYSKDLEFILINSYDDETKANETLNKFNIQSKKIIDSTKQIIDFFKIDMIGNVLILNKNKTKYWIGPPSILDEENLDKLILENKLPTFLLSEKYQNITKNKYKIEFSLGNSSQKRSLVSDEKYLKLTNTPLKSILEIYNNELNFIDNSLMTLYLNFEITTNSVSESNNQEIIDDILNLFNSQKSDCQEILNMDFLINYVTF